jgi:hypothetical protein
MAFPPTRFLKVTKRSWCETMKNSARSNAKKKKVLLLEWICVIMSNV